MSGEHFQNIMNASLFDYISAYDVRLVPSSIRNEYPGRTEIPLELHFKPSTVKKLSYSVPWGGVLYGFVRNADELSQKIGIKSELVRVTVSDWDERFVLIFGAQSEKDTLAFNISEEDALKLAGSCLRPPRF